MYLLLSSMTTTHQSQRCYWIKGFIPFVSITRIVHCSRRYTSSIIFLGGITSLAVSFGANAALVTSLVDCAILDRSFHDYKALMDTCETRCVVANSFLKEKSLDVEYYHKLLWSSPPQSAWLRFLLCQIPCLDGVGHFTYALRLSF